MNAFSKLDDIYAAGTKGEGLIGKQVYRGLMNLGAENAQDGARLLERGAVTAFNTMSESASEAKDTKNQALKELQLKRSIGLQGVKGYEQYANMTEEDMNNRAAEAAKSTFIANLGILSLSNWVESDWFVKGAKAKDEALANMFKGKTRDEMLSTIADIYKTKG
jgi:hypothetical protein